MTSGILLVVYEKTAWLLLSQSSLNIQIHVEEFWSITHGIVQDGPKNDAIYYQNLRKLTYSSTWCIFIGECIDMIDSVPRLLFTIEAYEIQHILRPNAYSWRYN